MKQVLNFLYPGLIALLLTACGGAGDSGDEGSGSGTDGAGGDTDQPELATAAALGEALFHDTDLSFQRTQSCATCHDASRAFSDARTDASGAVASVSLGGDDVSLGDRNAPALTYSALAPEFHSGTRARFNSTQSDYQGWLGGQFHDGRAVNQTEQAGGPFLNPIEMGMPDRASLIDRVREKPEYIESFEHLFGADVLSDTDTAWQALTSSIAAFEATPEFATFDSRYDRSLLDREDPDYYEYGILSLAARGKSLFFSTQFTNCATCHLQQRAGRSRESFSGFEYHNIGVPVNEAVRRANGLGSDHIDTGLLANPHLGQPDSSQHTGLFKTPTLRNVAVTAPYMHNGVFDELETVIRFYDHWLTGSNNTINPETGVSWAEPEVAETVSLTELKDGSLLSDDDVSALVCFMMTLTDARYEHLIANDEWQRCESEGLD